MAGLRPWGFLNKLRTSELELSGKEVSEMLKKMLILLCLGAFIAVATVGGCGGDDNGDDNGDDENGKEETDK